MTRKEIIENVKRIAKDTVYDIYEDDYYVYFKLKNEPASRMEWDAPVEPEFALYEDELSKFCENADLEYDYYLTEPDEENCTIFEIGADDRETHTVITVKDKLQDAIHYRYQKWNYIPIGTKLTVYNAYKLNGEYWQCKYGCRDFYLNKDDVKIVEE